ncbi:PIN domain-containing protein [Candidatus Poribacteria bacterium]|nr:PIN domain-containing protein [Candidatus Poribacteria bacterium]
MIYVLDTHILIWYFIGSERLHKSFKEKIDKVRNQEGKLLIPTIVLAEALNIAEKGKVKFDFNKMYKIIQEEPVFEIIGYGFEIFNASLKINGIKEIHDRIIVATAKFYQVNLLTKDKIINASGEVETSL